MQESYKAAVHRFFTYRPHEGGKTMNQRSERWWEKKLGVSTSGKTDNFIDESCNPYEPTEYCILERLAQSGYITSSDHFLDYGCGLGRSLFFMASQTGCRATGIEYDYDLYGEALKNLRRSRLPDRYKTGVRIVCADARTYHVRDENRFYFFNPFGGEILQIVIGRIRQSYYEHPRQIYLFFYYPYDDAAAALMTAEGLSFVDEIDCSDLYDVYDSHERILVFEFA